MNDLVSVIMPSYNSGQFIAKTIDSVINQSYSNWEILVVDDCSTDNSIQIIEEYQNKDKRIRLFQKEVNEGAAVARNIGIEKSKGRFIAFLDSDDLWKPDKLSSHIRFMIENEILFSYTSYDIIDTNDFMHGSFTIPLKVSYSDLLKTCSIGCLTVIYDSEKLGKVYMPLIRKRQDYGLWLKILKNVDFAYGLPKKLSTYRIRSNSISRNKLKAAKYQWKIYREIENIGFLKSIYYFIHYAYYGIFKYK